MLLNARTDSHSDMTLDGHRVNACLAFGAATVGVWCIVIDRERVSAFWYIAK